MYQHNDDIVSVFESRPTNELLWIYRENSEDWSTEALAEIKSILEKRGRLPIGALRGEDASDIKRRHNPALTRSTPVVVQATPAVVASATIRKYANASSLGDYRVYLWLFLMYTFSLVILILLTASYINTPFFYGIWIVVLPFGIYDSILRYRVWRFLIHHSNMHGLAIRINNPWKAVLSGSSIFSKAKPHHFQESFQRLVKHLQAEHAIGELKHPIPLSGLSALAEFVRTIITKRQVDTWPFFIVNANIACKKLDKLIRFLPQEAQAMGY